MSTHGCTSIPCTICGAGANDARRLREERDHYRELTHSFGERIAHMTSAAQSAAATAVTAIERIQFLQDVVDAAVEWRTASAAPCLRGEPDGDGPWCGTDGGHCRECPIDAAERTLWRKVDDYRLAVAERS